VLVLRCELHKRACRDAAAGVLHAFYRIRPGGPCQRLFVARVNHVRGGLPAEVVDGGTGHIGAHTRTVAIVKDGLGYRVSFLRGGVEKTIRVEEILVAAGRVPNVDLGLENAHVEYDPTGIKTNEYLQTSARHIYAAGDVVGHAEHTHTALLESQIAAHNMFSKSQLAPDYTATPRVTFTMPSVASVGLTEDDCIKRDLKVNKALAPLTIVARANTSDFRDGFAKIIADKKGTILGATVVAPDAGEIIHELALAVRLGLSARDIADTQHAFLSWSEVVRVAASKLAH